jgi:hypothetical protein
LSEADLMHIKQTSKSTIEMQIKEMATARVREQQREQSKQQHHHHQKHTSHNNNNNNNNDDDDDDVYGGQLPVQPTSERKPTLDDSMASGQSMPLPSPPINDALTALIRSELDSMRWLVVCLFCKILKRFICFCR